MIESYAWIGVGIFLLLVVAVVIGSFIEADSMNDTFEEGP